MVDRLELSTYDLAYICGGPPRVALVALVALRDDGQITISHALHRVKTVRRAPRDAVESAVLDAIPGAGITLGALTAVVAGSDAVVQVGAALREREVLTRSPWRPGRITHARRLRRRLRAGPPEGPGRVAVLGPAAITDTRLREIFQTPDPDLKPPVIKTPKPKESWLPDRNDRPYDAAADASTANMLQAFGPGGSFSGL